MAIVREEQLPGCSTFAELISEGYAVLNERGWITNCNVPLAKMLETVTKLVSRMTDQASQML